MIFRRYALVKQHDQSDCGAAALATIALHHGRPIGLQKMRDLAGTDCIGTNLLGLVKAAEKIGFEAQGVRGNLEALGETPLPAIAHVKTTEDHGHFVVVHSVSKRQIVVADPAREILRLTPGEFEKQWTGYLVLLVPRDEIPKVGSAKVSEKPWTLFLQLLRPHRALLAKAFLCALLLTALGLSTSFFVKHLVDSVLVHSEHRLLNALAIGMLVLLVFRTLFSIVRQVLLMHVGRKIDLALISGYARHVLRLPMGFFDMRRVGEVISRVSDTTKVREAVGGTTLSAIVDGTLVLFTTILMFAYDWSLSLVGVAAVPCLVLTVLLHHAVARRCSRTAMETAARLQSHLVEDITAVESIKGFGAEDARSEECDRQLVDVVQAGFSLQALGLRVSTLSTLVKGAAGIVTLWYGGHRVMEGALTVGELMFFHTLLATLLDPLERLAAVNLSLQDALVAVDRLYQILDIEQEELDVENGMPFEELRDSLNIDRVSFRYGCREKVLDDVSLQIPVGSTVAIVGESGSGKSTLLKILQRFYEPDEGRVVIDSVDARDYSLSSLRERIGVVSQDPFIFDGTLLENVTMSKGAPMSKEVLAAVRAAGLEDFVLGLPERFETKLGERGTNLSGGQRQRLAIARAILKDPEVLIFDEATSHLDTLTERAIQQSLEADLSEKTVIVVAHRLSTVRRADRIYLLHDGRIAEEGTHMELIAAGGRYAELWNAQIGAQAESLESNTAWENNSAKNKPWNRSLSHAS